MSGPAAAESGAVRPLVYDRDAVLTIAEVCVWLGGISERTFYRRGIRHVDGLVRAQWVYDYLERAA
jgi:hypothetical protein